MKKLSDKAKHYIDCGVIFLLVTLIWEGHHLLPGAKSISEIIPLWAVILNLIILFGISILLRKARHFSLLRGAVGIIIVFTISVIIWRIGYKHFSTFSFVAGMFILFIIWGLKKEDSEKQERT